MQPKRLWRAIALLMALIAASVLVAAQSESIRIGKKGEIELDATDPPRNDAAATRPLRGPARGP